MKFDITGQPPTQSEVTWGRKCDAIVLGLLFVGVFLLVGAVVVGLANQGVSPLPFIGGGLLFMFASANSTANNCEELPKEKCEKMLTLCEKTPEGRQYRAAVLALGRKFVMAEFHMMAQWVEEAPARLNCKKLYGIEVDDHDGSESKGS